jgi:hypothetical protein
MRISCRPQNYRKGKPRARKNKKIPRMRRTMFARRSTKRANATVFRNIVSAVTAFFTVLFTIISANQLFGASPTHFGRSLICFGRPLTCFGDSLTYFGNAQTHFGNAQTHLGDALTHFGDALTYFGDAQTYFGDSLTYFGSALSRSGNSRSHALLCFGL